MGTQFLVVETILLLYFDELGFINGIGLVWGYSLVILLDGLVWVSLMTIWFVTKRDLSTYGIVSYIK